MQYTLNIKGPEHTEQFKRQKYSFLFV